MKSATEQRAADAPDAPDAPEAPPAAQPDAAPAAPRPAAFVARASPWIAVAADTIVPLSVGVAAVLLFGLLEQARDALFGALGSRIRLPDGAWAFRGLGMFCWYGVAVCVFGNLLWYTSRVMAGTSLRDPAGGPGASGAGQARAHYPRLLAYLLMSLLFAVPVDLAREGGMGRAGALALAGLGLLAPALAVPLAQRWAGAGPRWAAWSVAGTITAEAMLMAFSPPDGAAWQAVLALVLASTAPTLCYVSWVRRRSWMGIADAADRPLPALGWRLCWFVAAFVVIFAVLAAMRASIARELGSPAIVMIALAGILVGLVSLRMLLRAVERRLPGLVAVGVLGAIAAAALVRLAYQVEPWREVPGNERVQDAVAAGPAPAPAPAPGPARNDIVVNAYGGGLRAALYTAAVLARLDDRSCGAFGRRLTAASGVSGGSLGLATYLLARQRVVAAGGWRDCDGTQPLVTGLVEDVLQRDHLSPVVARMVTVDLLPYVTPSRGQALLDSWDQAIREAASTRLALPPTAGLGLPLTALDGGITPAPLVLFNATDAATGQIFWMSNRGFWGRENEGDRHRLAIPLGLAVLHSARFPVVSPVGAFTDDAGKPVFLVDGGLSDVSGILTLSRKAPAPAVWLDIDGNFDRPACNAGEPATGLRTWSTLNALLALRGKQAALGMERMGATPRPIDARLTFAAGQQDPRARCAAIARLHMAPLGWYMSVRSAQDMKPAIEEAVDHACASLDGLCRAAR